MKPGKIRPLALAVVVHEGRILVAEGYDTFKERLFYRPLGGGIDFGERGADTVVRELREELDAELQNPRYLGALENIFTYEGQRGHEIILLYSGAFADPAFYARERLDSHEDDGTAFTAVWKPLADFGPGGPPLYPDGLLELISATAERKG
jgi:ADP-ribose pyrophosphatase YjhB (NUDIX family)